MLLVVAFGLAGGLVTVPYVALGPGPTENTLGAHKGKTLVDISGTTLYPTAGHLNMTTVNVSSDLTLFSALGLWSSGRFALAPEDEFYPPNKSQKQVEQENTKAFDTSKSRAEAAALRYLGYPFRVVVGTVSDKGPASGVLKQDDRLLEVNGKPVTQAATVTELLTGTKEGQQVAVKFQRGSEPENTATITLGKNPTFPDRGLIGIVPGERPEIPFKIDIGIDNIGGPSAGLMFALAIVDKLTPGELNGGQFVAGTGEITEDGTVKPIGGIPFKMIAAREAGATTFLVPAENCAEAKTRIPDGLNLVKVHSLKEGVDALNALREHRETPQC
ncbi:PDZ domain-containing protein [Pseudonocardiaceae bacterium YIM PH 21723]|nr:PDZ domain-containing protein [Pseudonocardiaceae bacterium YIM PH 21723]